MRACVRVRACVRAWGACTVARPITNGEIGCFLSHYNIWRDVIDNNYGAVMVIEDDAKFEPDFVRRLSATLDEIQNINLAWDLM